MKIISDLRNRVREIKDTEEMRWLNVVKAARESGEIDTPMDDEQIARMFLSSSSGGGMNVGVTTEKVVWLLQHFLC